MIHEANTHLTLLNVGIAHHKADWNWHNVRSPFARIYYIVEGHAQVLMSDRKLDLEPGRLYLIPPFTTHHYVCDGLFTHYYVHLYEQKDMSQQSLFDEWEIPYETDGQTEDLSMMRHLCQLMPHLSLKNPNPEAYDNRATLTDMLQADSQRPLFERMEVLGYLQILLSRFLRNAHQKIYTHEPRIQHAIYYIHKHINERIELDTLAAETLMSKDHLIRIFKRAMNETPANYITRKKLERAEFLLATTDIPVKNIAAGLGYEHTSYFIRVFHKHSDMTPQEYRETHKNKFDILA